ncbi:DNA (Cytosine-5)-methyltransferase DRM1/2 isoform 2 [Hibiscus syriacus]|uniref:DNA (Cytosine-5)-methyltransferase DRM1/2 isoform 2 n=1 Tax=Hibiscus syriacus TaxID=106335 RepID=A0A6A3ARP4_HIBSY|nr:DNA (Cytosine-5)-methyltransferase DRM1/2 isoform 2 [Hibiscus syriacus]
MISQILIVLSDTEEILNSDSDEENKLLYLTKMGFSEAETLIAMKRCDKNPLCNDPNYKKRLNSSYDFWEGNKQKKLEKKFLNEDDHAVHLSIPIIGSGVPTEPDQITQRTLPEDDIGSPYFYYENVALAPINVWTGISHAKLTERICKALEAYDDEPPSSVQKYVLDECCKWNLVWVGKNKVTPLELDEVEMLLEVAFCCLGIPLKTDEQELNDDWLEQLMSRFVEFDLVVSGIQRNNLTGNQDELEDFCWCIFLQ